MEDQHELSRPSDEITLKELILRLRELLFEVLKYWPWLILCAILGALAFGYKAWKTEPTYNASLTFAVADNSSGGVSSINAVLGRFGIRQGKQNLDKILELSKSRLIIQSSLFKQETLHSKNDFLANHLIDLMHLHEQWIEDTTGLKEFYFESDSIDGFTRNEYRVLKSLIGILKGSDSKAGLYSTSYDEDSGIMKMRISSPSEAFSIAFLENSFEELSGYYVNQTIQKAQKTFDIIQAKTDSIYNELRSAQYRLAKYEDESRNVLLRQQGALKESQLREEVLKFRVMYEEAVKNKELASFNLYDVTPYVSLIDSPIPPINPSKPSLFRNLVLGGLAGGFLTALFFLARRIFKDVMK